MTQALTCFCSALYKCSKHSKCSSALRRSSRSVLTADVGSGQLMLSWHYLGIRQGPIVRSLIATAKTARMWTEALCNSCVGACQLLRAAAAALVRAPYPKAVKVSKDQTTQHILVTQVLLGNILEICYAHTWSQEKWSRVWAVCSSSTAGTVKGHLFTQFFSIKRLFLHGSRQTEPKATQPPLLPGAFGAADWKVKYLSTLVWAHWFRIKTGNSCSPCETIASPVSKSGNHTASGTFTPCKITELYMVSDLISLINTTSLTALKYILLHCAKVWLFNFPDNCLPCLLRRYLDTLKAALEILFFLSLVAF